MAIGDMEEDMEATTTMDTGDADIGVRSRAYPPWGCHLNERQIGGSITSACCSMKLTLERFYNSCPFPHPLHTQPLVYNAREAAVNA